ncbi:MAG: GvpL/GvpF family gas vesicle protein [Gemmatimonadaceae bacterium]
MPTPPSRAHRYRRSPPNDPVAVFGVVTAAGLDDGARLAGTEVLVVRQLAALVESTSLGMAPDQTQQVSRYRSVVEHIFSQRNIVPVPCGTVFRSRASVARWLELHYSPLQDALDFVSDRATMRVRVGTRASPATQAAAVSVDGHLWTALRGLKADAVAAVPVVAHADTTSASDHSAACSYLIERDAIDGFERQVASLTSASPHLRVELVGPLPPYDFVKMDFGG